MIEQKKRRLSDAMKQSETIGEDILDEFKDYFKNLKRKYGGKKDIILSVIETDYEIFLNKLSEKYKIEYDDLFLALYFFKMGP